MENSSMEEEGMWMNGGGGTEGVGVDLLQLRHGGALVQQVKKAAVMVAC